MKASGAAVLALLAAATLAAQEAEPLTKTELVRLLAGDAYDAAEVVAIVRRSCVTFDPTSRDVEDFRRLGAGEELLRALEDCRAPVRATLQPAGVTIRAGASARVAAAASRADRPAVGIRLALAGSERVAGRRLAAVTDASGRATFEVPGGRVARSHRFPLVGVDSELGDAPSLAVHVVPGPPATARLAPSRLTVGAERDTTVRVVAALEDAYGNPARGRRVVLRDPSTGEEATAASDAQGEAAFLLEADRLRDGSALLLSAGGGVLAELPVEVRAADFETAGERLESEPPVGERAGDLPEAPPLEPRDSARAAAAGETTETAEAAEAREAARPDSIPATGEDLDRLETEVLISRGYRELSAGRPVHATAHFRTAVEREPENPRALEGLAEALARSGRPGEAATIYERAVAASPGDAELRLALARTLDQAGQRQEAERAYVDLLARNPERTTVAQELALLRGQPYRAEVSAWGGAILESGSSPTLRAAEASLLVTRSVRLWARYDRSLGLELPPLLRGRDLFEGFFGGAELLWGARRELATTVELGQRRDPASDLDQNVVRLEQTVRMPAGRSYAGVTVGGFLGRWFDRDDWLAYVRGRVPIGDRFSLGPGLFFGETIGTETSLTGRSPEREVRFLLPLAFRDPRGWLVEPGVAIGAVEGETEATTGRFVEGRLRLEAPIYGPQRFRVFLLHHSPPVGEPFQAATAGLALRLP